MHTEKSLVQAKSSYVIFSNKLWKEQNECDDLRSTTNTEKASKKKAWKVTRRYLGLFSGEEAVKMIIKSHVNTKEASNV